MKCDHNMPSMHKHTNRVNPIVIINRIFSVIYCSVGERIGIFYSLPVPQISIPRQSQRETKAVVNVFICHTDAQLVLYEVHV